MKLLVVEDDDDAAGHICQSLHRLQHQVVRARSGDEVRDLGKGNYAAIILDRMLPGLDGVALLRHWRDAGVETPVLMLTARGSIEDRVTGLDGGADDYLVKPFAQAELAARVAALLRRGPLGAAATRLAVGSIELDLIERRVTRGGQRIHLQPREFALLQLLAQNAGQPVTRTMFLERVWGLNFDPRTNIVESHLSRLRTKLNHGFDEDAIETVRGAGYLLRADA